MPLTPPIAPDANSAPAKTPPVTLESRARFSGINHVALATNHMEKTIRFYRDLLGFRLTAAMGQPGFRHYFFSIDGENAIAFFEWPDVEEPPRKPHGAPVVGPFSFDHLAFGVKTEDDLWLLKDKLEAAGFEVSNVVDHGIVHSVYTYDPNGIAIEFALAVKARPSRMVVGDSAAIPAALEGPEPQPGHWPPVDHPTPRKERKVFPGIGSDTKFE